MEEPKEYKEALDKAYKEAGHNAYFSNGFKAGFTFSDEQTKKVKETNSALQRFRIEDGASALKREGYLAGKLKELESQRNELLKALIDAKSRMDRCRSLLEETGSWNILDTKNLAKAIENTNKDGE